MLRHLPVALFAILLATAARSAEPVQTAVFTSGDGGYHTYRIPAMVVTTRQTVLAFCEGRKQHGSDSGDIDLLVRRSTDGGQTFSAPAVVWDDGTNTCGNPCPVVDRVSGVVHLLMTHNRGDDHEAEIIKQTSKGTRTVWISRSSDDGLSWSKPIEITKTTKLPDWTWYATGPGAGIQLDTGRLVVPCDHIEAQSRRYFSHVIYSDDHGQSWRLGGSAGPATNECEVVARRDGSLLLNMRNYDKAMRARAVATSSDQGQTWSAVSHDATLVEPICQASIRRIVAADGRSRIAFSNPASAKSRANLSLRLSYDEGQTWPVTKSLFAGPAAYSCLAALADGSVLCLYERGDKNPYQTITLARVPLDWLEAK